MRNEILKKINEIIKEDFPCTQISRFKELEEENLLVDSGLDSFGYAMFWLEIGEIYKLVEASEDEETKNKFVIEYINNIDYKTYKVKDLINRILECM